MPGLSAKVFRTYNASWTFQEQLKNTPPHGTVAEKIAAYNTANRMVAVLCNHQKTVSKGFDESFAKMGDKVGFFGFDHCISCADSLLASSVKVPKDETPFTALYTRT